MHHKNPSPCSCRQHPCPFFAVQVSDDLYFLAQAKHLLATRHAMTMLIFLVYIGFLPRAILPMQIRYHMFEAGIIIFGKVGQWEPRWLQLKLTENLFQESDLYTLEKMILSIPKLVITLRYIRQWLQTCSMEALPVWGRNPFGRIFFFKQVYSSTTTLDVWLTAQGFSGRTIPSGWTIPSAVGAWTSSESDESSWKMVVQ